MDAHDKYGKPVEKKYQNYTVLPLHSNPSERGPSDISHAFTDSDARSSMMCMSWKIYNVSNIPTMTAYVKTSKSKNAAYQKLSIMVLALEICNKAARKTSL